MYTIGIYKILLKKTSKFFDNSQVNQFLFIWFKNKFYLRIFG